MSKYVITAKTADTDEAYLSAIFEDNKLVNIVQNKKVSSEVKIEHISKFLLSIVSEERYYAKDISSFIENHVSVIDAIDVVGDNFVAIDF